MDQVLVKIKMIQPRRVGQTCYVGKQVMFQIQTVKAWKVNIPGDGANIIVIRDKMFKVWKAIVVGNIGYIVVERVKPVKHRQA
jgi:S-adenosylhomocysteine hydrolase